MQRTRGAANKPLLFLRWVEKQEWGCWRSSQNPAWTAAAARGIMQGKKGSSRMPRGLAGISQIKL